MAPPTAAQLKQALDAYPRALTLRAAASKSSAGLAELDNWYRTGLRDLVVERGAKDEEKRSYLEVAELGRLMEWKLAVSLVRLIHGHLFIVWPHHSAANGGRDSSLLPFPTRPLSFAPSPSSPAYSVATKLSNICQPSLVSVLRLPLPSSPSTSLPNTPS